MSASYELEGLRKEAWKLLSRFLSGTPAEALALTQTLAPRPGDYERVFLGDAAEKARQGYRELWAAPVAPLPREGQTSLLVTGALAAELSLDTERARSFAGGWARAASKLAPELVWFTWRYTRPGERVGMAWDGLVWVDDHWAWFPKAWRVIEG